MTTSRTLRRTLGFVALALALAAWTVVLFADRADAHQPELHSKVVRPCGATAPWFGQVTVQSDGDYGKNWQNRHSIGGGAFTGYSPLVDDQVAYRIDVFNISAGTASVVVDTQSRWQNKSGSGGVVGPLDGSITLHRPAAFDCPNTGTTTTTTTNTTSTTTPDDGGPPPKIIDRAPPAVPVVTPNLPYTG